MGAVVVVKNRYRRYVSSGSNREQVQAIWEEWQ